MTETVATLKKVSRNWKVTAGILVVLVVIILLLWPKFRQAAGNLIFGSPVLNIETGGVDYPDLNLTINYPPAVDYHGGDGCGCQSHGTEVYDDAMNYFINGMKEIATAYNADVMASRPTWAQQYWNNSLGYLQSVNAGRFFG